MTDKNEQHGEVVLNEVGISCDTHDTGILIDEHTRWRMAISRRQPGNVASQRYWKQRTSCASL